jgi:hypothetical protein
LEAGEEEDDEHTTLIRTDADPQASDEGDNLKSSGKR